ncbi:MAG: amino acid ABC transporter permease [Fusicatenibacter sp.]|nr:amino acid ABC transporter permease [Lachnospiraceae bacterium]MDY2937783.1 amino acid ABC transporter permease [Fusicatenibacter sp.]
MNSGYFFDSGAMIEIFFTCLSYVPICFFAATVSLLIGLVFGILLTVIRDSKWRILKALGNGYVLVVRGIPSILLLLLVFYFVRGGFTALAERFSWEANSSVIPPLFLAILALSASSAAFLSNTVKSALSSVDRGQKEAGLSLGMKPSTVFLRYVLPQAVPAALPMLGNQYITMLRATSLIGYVGVMDIVQAGKIKATLYSNNLEAYFAEAIIYWGLTILLERLFHWINKRNAWHSSAA